MTELGPGAPRLDAAGPAAPPRRNGELVFEAPWESRLFGVTMTLAERGMLDWEAFRRQLIAAVSEQEAADAFHYWRAWRTALERLLLASGACAQSELGDRLAQLRARPAGHDHS